MVRTKAYFLKGAIGMAALAAGLNATPLAAQEGPAAYYALPRQDLGETLLAIARMSGRQVLFTPELVAGRRAPVLEGAFTFEDALVRALADSGLVAEYRGDIAAIRPAPAGVAAAPPRGTAQQAITITGTRIRGASSASPVVVATREDLEEAGVTDLGGFARLLPQNFTGGQNPGVVGAGQGGQSNINNSTTLNLRGLGPDATLTLINGQRIAYDALNQGVDISAIPLAAVERVEVITDGASALHGSDAVGGVANIILRRSFAGIVTGARIGGSLDGGNFQRQFNLVTGAGWNGGGMMVAADFARSTAINASDRSYTNMLDDSATILPRQRQFSAVLSAHQRLNDSLTLELDAQFADRVSEKANVFRTNQDVFSNGLLNRPQVASYAIMPRLRLSLPGGWEAFAGASHAISRTRISARRFANSAETRGTLSYDNRIDALEAGAEGPLFELPGGSVRLAAGAGLRQLELDVLVTQTPPGGALRTTSDYVERRQVRFAYGELSLPLVSNANARPFLAEMRLSAALRYEDYDGIGDVFTPKFGIVYAPHSDLTLSATWGRSFKAPTLFQTNQARSASLIPLSLFSPQPAPPLPPGSAILVLGGGNPNLIAERASSWTVSAQVRPTAIAGLRMQVSYFDINYQDRIASPLTSTIGALGNPIFAELITLRPSPQQVLDIVAALPQPIDNLTGQPLDPANVSAIIDGSLRNAARERARGIDMLIEQQFELGGDQQVQLLAAASYLASDRQLSPGQPVIERAGIIFNPPHWRTRLGATWRQHGITLSAFANHVGGTRDDRFQPIARVDDFLTLDLIARLRFPDMRGPLAGTQLTISLLNLLNAQPDLIRNADPAAPPFDSTNQSAVGRFVGLAISRRW